MLIFLEILAVAVPFSRRLKLGGGFNPFEKYWPNWIISPSSGENKKYLKPLTRVFVVSKANGRNSRPIPNCPSDYRLQTPWLLPVAGLSGKKQLMTN